MSAAFRLAAGTTTADLRAVIVEHLAVLPGARGGTAELFTATCDGAPVIIKIARPGAPPGAIAAEARVLAQLGPETAPRLVGTTTIAERDAVVVEHVALPSLAASRSTIAAIAPATDRLVAAMRISAALCESVARVHEAGYAHGDLAPANILVDTQRASVRLVDFGLATPFGEMLPAYATRRYAAPERMAGVCRACPAIDVYALGVITFELVTGEHPFATLPDRVAHAAYRVPRLADRVSCSRSCDEAIAAAMAKDPGRRPSAVELAEALRMSVAMPATLQVPVVSEPSLEASCRRARLIAFTCELGPIAVGELAAELRASLAYSDGTRHVIAVWSQTSQLDVLLRARGACDLVAREASVRIDASGMPYGAIIVELARSTGRAIQPPADSRVDELPLIGRSDELARVVEVVRDVERGRAALVTVVAHAGLGKSRFAAAVIDAVATLSPATRDAIEIVELRAPTLAAALARFDHAVARGALRHVAARALANEIVRRPRVVIVDDGHDADPTFLDAIELATMSGDHAPVVVVVLARPALIATRPRWGRRAAAAVAVELAPLDREAGRRLVRELLPDVAAVPLAAIDRVVERCSGVPLYIRELVAALRRGGDAGTRGALPTDRIDLVGESIVAWSVADELATLSPGARVAVEVWSLAESCGQPPEVVFDAVARGGLAITLDPDVAMTELRDAGLVVADRLRHDLVRDAIAATIPAKRRGAIHRALLGLATRDDDRARHAEGAGELALAASAWRSAAATARAHHDDLAEELAAGCALACLAGVATAGANALPDAELLRRRGAARARLGRHDAAAADFSAARMAARDGDDRTLLIEISLDEATALDWALDHAGSAERVADAAALVREDDPAGMRARMAMAMGRTAWRAGDRDAAVIAWERSLALVAVAERSGEDMYDTAIAAQLMLGFVHGGAGRIELAAEVLDAALARATACGDLVHIAAVRCNRSPIHAARGDVDGLRRDLAAFTAIGRELGNAVTEYRGELYQALVAMWTAANADAVDHAERACRIETADPELFPRPRALLILAELAARANDRDAARSWWLRATAARSTQPCDGVMLDGISAWLDEGLDIAAAHELARRASDVGEPEAAFQLLELAARVADAGGRPDDAARLRADARDISGLPRFMSARGGAS